MTDISTAEIEALHRDSIVIDTHSDVLLALIDGERPNLGERSTLGQFDLPRALEGGLTAEVAAMYIPLRAGPGARQAIHYIDTFHREIEAFPNLVMPALSAGDIERAKELGKIALLLGMEGAEGLEGDLQVLRAFHRLGLRVLGLTWNWRNQAADGVGELRTGGGLTEFGVALVKECNRLGIAIDMAHLAPPGVRDVLEVSERPVVVTHGNCHALWENRRNLTDAQLEAIAAKGGVVGVTAVPAFLGADEKHAPLSAMLDHVDHMVKVMGEDHVGLGTDFDGVHDARVEGLEDASRLPNLTRGLAERGYAPATIQKILGGNFLRIFRQVL